MIAKDMVQRTELLRWAARHIAERGPETTWVTTHSKPIVKASLSFPAKF